MSKLQLRKRLESYWRLELFNALFLPSTGLALLFIFEQPVSMLCIASLVMMSAILVLGGCYWRAKARDIASRESVALPSVLHWASRLEIPILVGVIATFAACLADLFVLELSAGVGDRVLTLFAATLALLEYINYYHVQLQHFDHRADFQRLISGRGFRRAHLRADLDHSARRSRKSCGNE